MFNKKYCIFCLFQYLKSFEEVDWEMEAHGGFSWILKGKDVWRDLFEKKIVKRDID